MHIGSLEHVSPCQPLPFLDIFRPFILRLRSLSVSHINDDISHNAISGGLCARLQPSFCVLALQRLLKS